MARQQEGSRRRKRTGALIDKAHLAKDAVLIADILGAVWMDLDGGIDDSLLNAHTETSIVTATTDTIGTIVLIIVSVVS